MMKRMTEENAERESERMMTESRKRIMQEWTCQKRKETPHVSVMCACQTCKNRNGKEASLTDREQNKEALTTLNSNGHWTHKPGIQKFGALRVNHILFIGLACTIALTFLNIKWAGLLGLPYQWADQINCLNACISCVRFDLVSEMSVCGNQMKERGLSNHLQLDVGLFPITDNCACDTSIEIVMRGTLFTHGPNAGDEQTEDASDCCCLELAQDGAEGKLWQQDFEKN